MIDAYLRLIDELPDLFKDDSDSPKMVIAIDDAHTLSKPMGKGYQLSHILCKVIGAFTRSKPSVSNWVVFVSTQLEVAKFSAPSRLGE